MGDFPGITELEPLIGLLHLVAVQDALPEYAKVITQAVTDGGQAESRHRIEETGGQTPEAAVAQTGVDFVIAQGFPMKAELRHGLAAGLFELEVDDVVAEQPADQE